MAVVERGEVDITVGGQRYTLVLDLEAICNLEAASGLTLAQIMARAESGSMTHSRSLLFASIQRHQPTFSLEQMNRWTLNDIVSAMAMFRDDAVKSATPDPVDAKALGVKRPQRARAKK